MNEDPYKGKHIRERPCEACGNPPPHRWDAWGVYTDKDLRCRACGFLIDVWNN